MSDNITENELDDMINDLEAEDFNTGEEDMQQAYLDKLDEILSAIKSETFRQKRNIAEDKKLVKELTVGELKLLIKEFTNDIINAINKKQRIEYVPGLPPTPQPNWYGPNTPPWETQKVWCTDHTEVDRDITELMKKVDGDING